MHFYLTWFFIQFVIHQAVSQLKFTFTGTIDFPIEDCGSFRNRVERNEKTKTICFCAMTRNTVPTKYCLKPEAKLTIDDIQEVIEDTKSSAKPILNLLKEIKKTMSTTPKPAAMTTVSNNLGTSTRAPEESKEKTTISPRKKISQALSTSNPIPALVTTAIPFIREESDSLEVTREQPEDKTPAKQQHSRPRKDKSEAVAPSEGTNKKVRPAEVPIARAKSKPDGKSSNRMRGTDSEPRSEKTTAPLNTPNPKGQSSTAVSRQTQQKTPRQVEVPIKQRGKKGETSKNKNPV